MDVRPYNKAEFVWHLAQEAHLTPLTDKLNGEPSRVLKKIISLKPITSMAELKKFSKKFTKEFNLISVHIPKEDESADGGYSVFDLQLIFEHTVEDSSGFVCIIVACRVAATDACCNLQDFHDDDILSIRLLGQLCGNNSYGKTIYKQ